MLDVWLVEIGPDPIAVLREVREQAQLELAAAKQLMDQVPALLFAGQSEEAARALERRFIAIGARVEFKDAVPAPEMRQVLDTDPTPIPAPAVRKGEPSMDWAEDELRFYAMTKNIDVSKAKSKTQLLRAIRGIK
jgi:hypothetical protein